MNSSDSPHPGFLWDFYGATMSSVLCQLGSDGRLTDAPATLIPYDEPSPNCIYVAPYVKATRLTPKPVAPGNYTLVLTNDTCTSPFLLRSPPLFYTGKYTFVGVLLLELVQMFALLCCMTRRHQCCQATLLLRQVSLYYVQIVMDIS